jgi:hypothetical protein
MILESLSPTYGLIWPPGKYFARPDIFGSIQRQPGRHDVVGWSGRRTFPTLHRGCRCDLQIYERATGVTAVGSGCSPASRGGGGDLRPPSVFTGVIIVGSRKGQN